jgi:endo-1,3-1,4-beta-glycanase ExoK
MMAQGPLHAVLLPGLMSLAIGCAHAQAGFVEEFDRLDEGRWFRSDGWTNGPWMNCQWSREAAGVADGVLTLEVRATANGLACGEVQSVAEYGYGSYEIVLRTGRGSGLNAAFFTYIGPVHDRAHHEIDIELLLRDTATVTFNTFVEAVPVNGGAAPLPVPGDAAFRSYGFTWRPDGITWFVDAVPVHRTAPGAPLPQPPQKIYASLWSSDSFPDWMGPFDADALPAQLHIDRIAFTPLGADCLFPGSIACGEE